MTEQELKRWRLRMNVGTTTPATHSAADTGFISSEELDDLYQLHVLTAEENNWEPETREQFEARYRKEIAQRDNRESGNG